MGNKSVVLQDRQGNTCYPKTIYQNVIGLPTILADGTKVYFGSGQPTTDATAFDDIDNNSLYLDTSLENKSAMLYRVDSISNNVIIWDPYKYIADANIQILGNKISFVSGYSIDSEVTYDSTGTGLINHRTGNIDNSTWTTVQYKKKAVSLGDVYFIKGYTFNNNASYSALTLLDSNNNVIDYYPKDTSSGYLTKHVVNITDPNVAYIVVNGSTSNNIPVIYNASIMDIDNYIDESTSFLSDKPAFKGTTELAVLEGGLFNWTNGGIFQPTSETYRHASIDVNVGETYHISGLSTNYGRQYTFIVILDKLGNVVDRYPIADTSEGTMYFKDFKYTVKNKDAATMVINGSISLTSQKPSIKKATQTSVEDYVANTDPSYLVNFINMADMIKRVREGSKTFSWGPFDTGYMTLVFDDGRHDLSRVSSILSDHNVPFCAAIPPSTLIGVQDDNRKTLEVCNEIVANGGEILAHEFNPLTSATDYENIKRIVADSKEKLINAGFDVRGLMKPGGTGAISWKDANLQRFTQMYYDYADVCGDDDQYYKPRTGLSNSIATLKGYVDDAITNNKWYVMIGHTLDGTEGVLNEELFVEFLEYALQQGIQFKTYAYIYDNFGNWN